MRRNILRNLSPSFDSGHGYLRRQSRFGSHRTYSIPTVVQTPGNQVRTKISNGMGQPIEIIITYPPRHEHESPIILALGSGIGQYDYERVVQALSWSTNATVVSPIYQISRQRAFPAPVHMTLGLFDWVSQNLVQAENQRRKIGVYGSGVYGALATMLALTECNPMRDHISAAAVDDPVLDWTDVFPVNREMTVEDLQSKEADVETAEMPSNPDVMSKWAEDRQRVLKLRREIFTSAEDFFDPFASPLLFFRTPHFDLPYSFYRNAPPDFHRPGSEDEDGSIIVRRKRIYHRAYPPLRSGLVFPAMRMTVGSNSILRHQPSELVSLMHRSIVRNQNHSDASVNQNLDARFVIDERKESYTQDQRHIAAMGQWLGEAIRA